MLIWDFLPVQINLYWSEDTKDRYKIETWFVGLNFFYNLCVAYYISSWKSVALKIFVNLWNQIWRAGEMFSIWSNNLKKTFIKIFVNLWTASSLFPWTRPIRSSGSAPSIAWNFFWGEIFNEMYVQNSTEKYQTLWLIKQKREAKMKKEDKSTWNVIAPTMV